MSACFHLPSVTCDNCAHLEKSSAKSPWVGVVSTGASQAPERTSLAPGEGTWSVFALKAVEERDALREENDDLKKEVARLKQRESDLKFALGTDGLDALVWMVRCKAAKKERDSAQSERDEARAFTSKLHRALKAYYHECKCQHDGMDAVNMEAYRLIQQGEER